MNGRSARVCRRRAINPGAAAAPAAHRRAPGTHTAVVRMVRGRFDDRHVGVLRLDGAHRLAGMPRLRRCGTSIRVLAAAESSHRGRRSRYSACSIGAIDACALGCRRLPRHGAESASATVYGDPARARREHPAREVGKAAGTSSARPACDVVEQGEHAADAMVREERPGGARLRKIVDHRPVADGRPDEAVAQCEGLCVRLPAWSSTGNVRCVPMSPLSFREQGPACRRGRHRRRRSDLRAASAVRRRGAR